jgi:hypothetical protein
MLPFSRRLHSQESATRKPLCAGLCLSAAAGSGTGSLFRSQKGNQDVPFHARRRFDLRVLANFSEQAGHLGAAYFLVGHFAATMKNHGANFMAFPKEPDDLVLANLKIMLRGCGTKLHFLQLRTTAALALLVGFLVLLVLEFAVIGDLANRRIGCGRNLHQIQTAFTRQSHSFKRLHDAQLPAIFVNYPDFASPDPLVDADTVRLPEIPLSDKTP